MSAIELTRWRMFFPLQKEIQDELHSEAEFDRAMAKSRAAREED